MRDCANVLCSQVSHTTIELTIKLLEMPGLFYRHSYRHGVDKITQTSGAQQNKNWNVGRQEIGKFIKHFGVQHKNTHNDKIKDCDHVGRLGYAQGRQGKTWRSFQLKQMGGEVVDNVFNGGNCGINKQVPFQICFLLRYWETRFLL